MERVLVVLLGLFTLSLAKECMEGKFPCGDLCISHRRTCYCGTGQIYGNYGLPGDYCCVEDETSGCKARRGDAECPQGNVTSLTEKCGGECLQEYKHSLTHDLWSTYGCYNGDCTRVEDMCKGYAACSDGSDVAECNEGLQCITTNGPYEKTTYKEHYQCQYLHDTDNEYDNIHRKDVKFFSEGIKGRGLYHIYSHIHYSVFSKCTFPTRTNKTDINWRELVSVGGTTGIGLTCNEDVCIPPQKWCLDRTKFSITTLKCQENITIATDDSSLCRNTTFWKIFTKTDSCDIYIKSTERNNGEIFASGSRCTGNLQHCYYPWYKWNYYTYLPRNYLPTCSDNSDKIFHIGTTCNITSYVKTYCDNICNPSKQLEHCNRMICDNTSQWMEDNKNDAFLMDPHDCQSSCLDPGPGCEACTNSTYFKCKDYKTCLHPDLLCDGHPHCQDGSDEDFNFCFFDTVAYAKKNVVKKFATLKCRSRIYPQIYTIATVCDGVVECDGDIDEPNICNDSSAETIGISFIVLFTTFMYFVQKCIYAFCITKPKPTHQPLKLDSSDAEFENELSYLNLHNKKEFKERINIYLANLKYFTQKKETKKRVMRIIEFEKMYHNNDYQQALCWLHNNLNLELFEMIMEILDPGILERKVPKLRNIIDRILENKFMITILNILLLISQQLDIFKDSFLAFNIFAVIGGSETLINLPHHFTSMVVITMSLTIIIPLLISSVGLIIEDPAVILTPLIENVSRKLKYFVQLQIFFLSFFNSALLVNAYNENVAKRFKESGEHLMRRLEEGRRIKNQYIKYLRSEIGLEIFYQVPIQIVLPLIDFTNTKTTEWKPLDIFFTAESFLGINALVIFYLSSCWSVISSVLIHRKVLKDEKVYLPLTSQVFVCLWGLAGSLKRIISIVVVFIPSLGLFNLLHHWQAEQMPFQIRRKRAEDGLLTAQDKLELNGLTEDVYWNQLDRTDWTDPFNPVFPEYSSYTGLSLFGYFCSFLLLLVLQFFSILLTKFILVKDIRETQGQKLDIFRHCLQSMNIPVPWEDFDVQGGSIADYKRRRKNVNKEMFWVMVINLIFHILMLVPLIYTGSNIISRHDLLRRTIGTKEGEDKSFENILILLPVCIVSVLGLSILEMVFYFIYSLKSSPYDHCDPPGQEEPSTLTAGTDPLDPLSMEPMPTPSPPSPVLEQHGDLELTPIPLSRCSSVPAPPSTSSLESSEEEDMESDSKEVEGRGDSKELTESPLSIAIVE